MKGDESRPKPSSDLRCKAEERLRDQAQDAGDLSGDDVRELLHEFRVHQVELEMQNEQLREAQRQLAESRDKYYNLFEFAPIGYFTIDQNGLICEVNLAGAGMLGMERSKIIKRGFSRLVAREFEDVSFHHRREVLETNLKQTCELELLRPDGTSFWAYLESIPVSDPNGNSPRIRTAIIDLTERKRLEAQLIQSEKLASAGTLAYGIAHEFNNILASILGAAELGAASRSPQEIKEFFEIIAESCQRGGSIAESLLAVAGERRMKKQTVDIRQTLLNVLALSRAQLQEANVKMVEEISEVPPMFCDPGDLSEVFLNMISNARDAMLPDGGTLTVSLRHQDDDIRIVFQDTGTGIPEDIKSRIFDPFVTTKGPLGKSGIPGTGLGLFVSYGIIRSYQGTIEVESSLGKGTAFTIFVPVSKNAPPDSAGLEQDKQPESISKQLNILLVDDEKAICWPLKKFLESKGHQVTASLTAKGGFDCFTQSRFDLVLSDLTIPDMDGIKLIQKIKERDRQARVIALTGHVEKSREIQARNAGADEVLIKPFRNSVLYDTIARICQRA